MPGFQVLRDRWSAVLFKVSGGGHGEHAHFHQFAGDQRGGLWDAEANGQVKAVGHQVAELVTGVQVELQLRVLAHEVAEYRAKDQPRKIRVDVHP